MNKNIASIMLANLIIAQSACGMAPEQGQLSAEQQQACRNAVGELATLYEQTEPSVRRASLAGSATTFLGSVVGFRRAGFSRKSTAALSAVAGLAGWVGSGWLGSHYTRQPEETRLLGEAGQVPALRAIPQQTARRLADALHPVWFGDNIIGNDTPYGQATGEHLPVQDDNQGFYEVKAAKALLTHLAQMPQEDYASVD